MTTRRLYQNGKCVALVTLADTYVYEGFRFEISSRAGKGQAPSGIYVYEGFRFEISYGIPQKIRKDGEPAKREGQKFWDAYYAWQKLPTVEREKYRV
ncbi:hypothetical protein EBZ80_10455 [bacterium]|nr:hypothetical protein [bacterium]